MKKNLYFSVNLIILLFLLVPAISCLAKPKNDAEYLVLKKTITLYEDGSADFSCYKELKLHSNRSFFHDFGESFIIYNPDYQTLTINQAYTIRKDGSIVQTPPNAFNEVLPNSCTNCQRYNNMKEMVVTHTALEYEATIVLEYTIHSRTYHFDEIILEEPIHEYAPIKYCEINIRYPKDLPSTDIVYPESPIFKLKKIKDSQYTHLQFIANNIPQNSSEFYQDNTDKYFVFSTINNKTFFHEFFKQSAFSMRLRINYTNLFSSLLAPYSKEPESTSALKKICALRDFVVDNITYNALPMEKNNFYIANAATVWNSNCGNEVEKAILLKDILLKAGYKAEVGIIFKNIPIHTHACVRVDIDDNKTILLSPISKNNISLELLYPNYYIAFPQEEITTLKSVSYNIAFSNHITITPQLQISETITPKTIEAPTKKFFSQKNEKDAYVTLENSTQNYYKLTLHEENYGININPSLLSTHRETSLLCPITQEEYHYTITLPKNAQWVSQPLHIQHNTQFGNLEIFSELDSQNNLLIIRKLQITKPIIGKKEYKKFRQLIIDWESQSFKQYYFKTNL